MDYILLRVEEPCGKTVPQDILAGVCFFETIGGVAEVDRLGSHSGWQDLERGAPPVSKAPMLPPALVGALELLVCCEEESFYLRFFAWFRLVKIWASCRFDDLQGLDPSTLILSRDGMSGLIDQTKTSGPGKRIRYLPIFISFEAYVLAPDWLRVGHTFLTCRALAYRRDHLLPRATKDMNSIVRIPAMYPDAMVYTQALILSLRRPVQKGGRWMLGHERLLEAEASRHYWREHSDRNFQTTVAALAG